MKKHFVISSAILIFSAMFLTGCGSSTDSKSVSQNESDTSGTEISDSDGTADDAGSSDSAASGNSGSDDAADDAGSSDSAADDAGSSDSAADDTGSSDSAADDTGSSDSAADDTGSSDSAVSDDSGSDDTVSDASGSGSMASAPSGSDGTTSDTGRETVTIAMWGDQLMENYVPWLQEQFPDVDFVFYSATNTTDYYQYLADQDQLPDIMTVRRFSLKDVESFRDQLMDLSDTELAQSFYQSYLRSYTYSDGTVNWLPASAEIDDIIINKTLFEENGIEIPTDYASFVAACEAFEELGITGYVTDMINDYTCMETLQGFSISALRSAEGIQWRQDYESGETNQLSEEVWMPVFEKMEDLIQVTGMDESNLELRGGDIGKSFTEGKVAMFRGGVQYMGLYGEQYEKLILPYPGDTESESFYLTYPVFQVAAKATESSEREELILEILTAMLSEDGLNHIIPGQSMIAYNRNVEMNLSEEIQNLEPYIEENRMYIRLASSDMFSISKTVVQGMLSGELATAQEAFDEFNRILLENENRDEEPVAAHLDTTYYREFTEEGGNQAASAVANTLREELGTDCLIMQSAAVGIDIIAGDYTTSELNYLFNWESCDMRLMNLTGEELKNYVEFYLTVKQTRDSVTNDSTLPVSSGFEMVISRQDDGYHLEELTIDGEAIDPDKTYSVASWDGYVSNYTDVIENSGFTEYEISDRDPDALLQQRLVEEGGQLSTPTDYITLQ